MINETTRYRTVFSLNLPQQAPPVDRTAARCSAVADAGVEADISWGDVWNAVKTYGPPIASAVGALL